MKKIGLICLALVLTLGVLGVGYAAWTDTVVMKQTVETGSLEAGIFAVAVKQGDEKQVCTVTVTHEPETEKFRKLVDPVPDAALFPAGTYLFYESATIDIVNFYPSFWILEDYVIGIVGSVPVRLHVTSTIADPLGVYMHMDLSWVIYLIRDGVITTLDGGSGKADTQFPLIEEALEGYQLHGCDVVIIYLDKYLQQAAPQGAKASYTLAVEAIQYNKYDEYFGGPD